MTHSFPTRRSSDLGQLRQPRGHRPLSRRPPVRLSGVHDAGPVRASGAHRGGDADTHCDPDRRSPYRLSRAAPCCTPSFSCAPRSRLPAGLSRLSFPFPPPLFPLPFFLLLPPLFSLLLFFFPPH